MENMENFITLGTLAAVLGSAIGSEIQFIKIRKKLQEIQKHLGINEKKK